MNISVSFSREQRFGICFRLGTWICSGASPVVSRENQAFCKLTCRKLAKECFCFSEVLFRKLTFEISKKGADFMSMTMTQKILAAHAGLDKVEAGELV